MHRCLLVSVVTALLMAGPAFAQDPIGDAYGGAGNVNSTAATAPGSSGSAAETDAGVAVASPAAAKPLRGDELPFTGLDLALLAFGGGLLLALGFGLRHARRNPAT